MEFGKVPKWIDAEGKTQYEKFKLSMKIREVRIAIHSATTKSEIEALESQLKALEAERKAMDDTKN